MIRLKMFLVACLMVLMIQPAGAQTKEKKKKRKKNKTEAIVVQPDTMALDTVLLDTVVAESPADDGAVTELPPEDDSVWPRNLQVGLDQLLQSDLMQTSQLGLMVWDLTADSCLYRHNALHRMRPASTQKTVTAIATLDRLGSSYQLATRLSLSGDIQEWNDTLTGATRRTLRGNLYVTGGMDPFFDDSDLRAFADAVLALHVDTIIGQFCIDKSFKDRDRYGSGWCWDDDNPVLTPWLYQRKEASLSLLSDRLRAAHVVLYVGTAEAAAPASARELCVRRHALTDVLRPMMKNSNNLMAECVFYQLAHAESGAGATAKGARSYIDRLVTKAGANQKLIHAADGSGLSLYNYVTADMEVRLLRYAYLNRSIYNALLPVLPVAGVDGTLKSRMQGTPAYNNVHAKTGTVNGVSSLCGYCTAANGHRLCFAILNQGVVTAREGRQFQDRVCTVLCR